MILIYAELVPSKGGPKCSDFADLRNRSKLLLIGAADKKDTIVLPTVAISELLVPVPKNQKGALILAFQQRFVCPPLDIRSASIAADLWSDFKNLPHDQQYGKRNVLRADTLIVASAYTANATHFYSHDEQCRALAKLTGMVALDLPTPKTLEDGFVLSDIKDGNA